MKRIPIALLLLAALAVGCARPGEMPPPDEPAANEAAPAAEATPPAVEATPPAVRATAHATAAVITETPDLMVWAEPDLRPRVSRLLPDPEEGVWGGQDGELFHFRVMPDRTFGRVTYGRPDPAAIWLGHLVRLPEGQLVGQVVTRHLVRKAPDGKVEEVAPGRSPAGAPLDFLDVREGRLHLHDDLGHWWTLGEDGALEPVRALSSGSRKGHPGLGAAEQEALEREAGGRVRAWIVPLADGSAYALIDREQLFRFDPATGRFTLLGQPDLAPIATLDGQVVARSESGLALVDRDGKLVRAYAIDLRGQYVFPGEDGWFWSLPFLAINLRTGEQRPLDLPELRGGAVAHLIPWGEGRMVGGTRFGGSLFRFDPETGAVERWGRPIPELGQETGEEVAPIDGLAVGSDGYLYAAIGTGARGRRESHLLRMDETGRVLASTWLPEPVRDLVKGADGRIYGAGYAGVVVVPLEGQVR